MQKEWIPRVEGIDFPAILKARGIDDKDIPMFVVPRTLRMKCHLENLHT